MLDINLGKLLSLKQQLPTPQTNGVLAQFPHRWNSKELANSVLQVRGYEALKSLPIHLHCRKHAPAKLRNSGWSAAVVPMVHVQPPHSEVRRRHLTAKGELSRPRSLLWRYLVWQFRAPRSIRLPADRRGGRCSIIAMERRNALLLVVIAIGAIALGLQSADQHNANYTVRMLAIVVWGGRSARSKDLGRLFAHHMFGTA